ncbi:phosphatase PAP2 family protein [Fictibacillus sp. Mic-4]|uniref:phosphatase PAP2 family protein n=1 Tax=Fictibacillus sp. Mic-4 TaxID=3132826 RepID=UPI003CE9867C
MFQKLKKNILPLSLMLSIPLLHLIYEHLNNGDDGARILVTTIDLHIPFLKVFIIPYVFWYVYLFIMFTWLCFADRPVYYKTLLSLTIGMGICYIIYYFFQTTVPRPEVTGTDLLSSMVKLIYGSDQPFNCFPSIHVFSSYLMILAIRHSQLKNRWNVTLITSISWLIILSTMFVKQHVVLDGIAGILLGNTLFTIIYYFETGYAFSLVKRIFTKNKKATESVK